MKYAVIGVGALGGFYGGLLARIGLDVHFLARSDYEHLRDFGLRVESKLGDFELKSLNVYRDTSEMPPCDVIIVCTKSTQNDLVVPQIRPLIHSKTIVIVLQNGLLVEKPYAEVLGMVESWVGVVFFARTRSPRATFVTWITAGSRWEAIAGWMKSKLRWMSHSATPSPMIFRKLASI